jgi:type VI secretion system secreted protein VgrG
MRVNGLVCVLVGLCVGGPIVAYGAGNPVVDALAQGTVLQFTGQEAISQPFQFDVTIATNDKGLNMAVAVGHPIAVNLVPGRVLTGMIERVEQIDGPGSQGLYRLRIVPGIQRLQYRTTSRTLYGKNVADLTIQLLNEAGLTQVELRLAGALPVEEMLVQYQESDLAFVSRLLESTGIHYHFESSPAGEKVVLSDGNAGFPVSAAGKIPFGQTGGPAITSIVRGQTLHAGQVQAGDYNWKTPGSDLSATAQAAVFGELTERVFPAGVETKPESQGSANVRLAARISGAQSCSGESTHPQLQAGTRIFLTGHPRPDFNQEYVITAVEHLMTGKEYRNQFRCLPAQIVFRPQPVTPVPIVAGVVSGIVVGPPGETRHVDQFGRVKVRFPWRSPAHSNPNDPGDAGFVRVAQIAAGVGATAMWLPDVGDEVLVAFEHGDPRRPVVIGSLYNGKDVPPAALPANKHLSILRHQNPNGAKTELVYDGTSGNERLLIQSGQNGLTLAANGITVHGPSVSISSTGDLVQRAGRSLLAEAGADLSVKAGQNLTVVSQKEALINVAGASRVSVGTDAQMTVGSNLALSVGGSSVVEHGKDLSIKAGAGVLLQAARTARLTAGEDALIQTGRAFVLSASTMMQFVAAQTGTIQAAKGLLIKSDGDIDILGKDIDAKASGNLTLKGSKVTQN